MAGDNGISIQKYATAEDHAELRGLSSHVPVAVGAPPASPPPPRAVVKKGKTSKIAKTKENKLRKADELREAGALTRAEGETASGKGKKKSKG